MTINPENLFLPEGVNPSAQLTRVGYFIAPDYPGRQAFICRFKDVLIHAAANLHGPQCAEQLVRLGLNKLHECFPVEKIALLRHKAIDIMRNEILTTMTAIAQHGAGLAHPFYLSDGLNLRIVYPFLTASHALPTESFPHPSDFSPHAFTQNPGYWLAYQWKESRYRLLLKWRRLSRPAYASQDLRQYNRGRPAATWSHAPHQDSWSGQASNNINVWCAIAGVNRHSSMVFYPDHYGEYFHHNPGSFYINPGQPPGKPVKLGMEDGQALVFNPEVLHSTHLNISDETRIVISARVNPGRPVFNQGPIRLERHWHLSTNIEAGRFQALVTAGKRVCHEQQVCVEQSHVECIELPLALKNSATVRVCESRKIPDNGRLRVKLEDAEVLIIRKKNLLRAFSARCPHVGVALEDGYISDQNIYCPGHAIAFNLETGQSRCSKLSLNCYAVSEKEGFICLRYPGLE